MIPVLQLDPMSLFIWMEPGKFGDDALGDAIRAALDAAWRGEGFVEAIQSHARSEEEGLHAAWLGSCMWHEKRHFLDLCLTSYGAWRLRHMFVIAANSFSAAASLTKAGMPVTYPMTIYRDAVRLEALGLPAAPPLVERLAADIASRKEELQREGAPLIHDGRSLTIGGDAQMESLALVSQLHTTARLFGAGPAGRVYDSFVSQMDVGGLYRWIDLVAPALGCARERADGTLEPDHELATALMVAGLCGRWLGPGRGEASLTYPSERFGRLFVEFQGKGRFGMSTEECASLVDRAARRIWGRGLWEELEADLAENEKVGEMLRQQFGGLGTLCEAFDDLQRLRRTILDDVTADGPMGLSPRAFGKRWANRLRPLRLHVQPGGDAWARSDERIVHFGWRPKHVETGIAWTWREDSPEHAADAVGLDPQPWAFILERAAPHAKLALSGRRHDLMLGKELQHILGVMEAEGIKARFEPIYAEAAPRSLEARRRSALSYADLVRRSHFNCDITGDRIPASAAMLLRGAEFRRSKLLDEYRRRAEMDPDQLKLRLHRDWSDWIVRADLPT
jgi:hypothetical protein